MDCLDCHNRPAHASEMPENAVDKQMSIGRISPDLPYIKKKGGRGAQGELHHSRRGRSRASLSEITKFYQTQLP